MVNRIGTMDSKLVRTNDDIKEAVTVWCTSRTAAEKKYGHISDWDTSAVTNMRELFKDCTEFNDDISGWNVSQVTDMYCMFAGAAAFNQDIGQWNESQVVEPVSISSRRNTRRECVEGDAFLDSDDEGATVQATTIKLSKATLSDDDDDDSQVLSAKSLGADLDDDDDYDYDDLFNL